MEPSRNDKQFNNRHSGTSHAAKPDSKRDSTDSKTIAAVARTRSEDQKPSQLQRQPNLPNLRLLWSTEMQNMQEAEAAETQANQEAEAAELIPRAFSSRSPYSPPTTPHSTSPPTSKTSPLEISEGRLSSLFSEAELGHATEESSSPMISRVPRFLTQNDQPRSLPLNISPPNPLPLLNLQALQASSTPPSAPRQRSARELAVGFQGNPAAPAANSGTPPNSERGRALTPKGKGEKMPDYAVRKSSAEDLPILAVRNRRERVPTPRRIQSSTEDILSPIVMTRSAPISRCLSIQERDNITLRLEDMLRTKNFLKEKDMVSAIKYYILDNAEMLRTQKGRDKLSLEDLKKDIKPISTDIYISFMKSPILFDSLVTHLTTSLELIILELEACKKAQQVQESESWPSTQSHMLNLNQKLALANAFPTPEALADLMKCLNSTGESLKKTLDSASKSNTTELDPGEDWKKCLKGLRDIIYKFGCFDISLQEKLAFFKDHSKIKFEDRKIREIFESIMAPLAPCCSILESFYKKDVMNKIQRIAGVALQDCEDFMTIPKNHFQWVPGKEKLKDSEDVRNKPLENLPPSATLRTLFTHRSISINGSNLDKYYQGIPKDDFSQKLEGPNIPKSIKEYYIRMLCKIYMAGYANEFNAYENKAVRKAKIRQFAENQLARILENKLLEADSPMAQVFRLISTECWARCDAFARDGMPALFKDPLHMKHATGNSTTCQINILGPNNFSVTLCRDHEIYPTYLSQDKSYFIVNKEKLICKVKLFWTISPSNDGRAGYKAHLAMSVPEFTPTASSKERWKIRRAMIRFGQVQKSKQKAIF